MNELILKRISNKIIAVEQKGNQKALKILKNLKDEIIREKLEGNNEQVIVLVKTKKLISEMASNEFRRLNFPIVAQQESDISVILQELLS